MENNNKNSIRTDYTIKPALIKQNGVAISPICHVSTVHLKQGVLKDILESAYEKFHNKNIAEWELNEIVIKVSDWESDDGVYKFRAGYIKDIDIEKYTIKGTITLEYNSSVILHSNPKFKYISMEIEGRDIYIYTNVLPWDTIRLYGILTGTYNIEMKKKIPKNLTVSIDSGDFSTNISDGKCSTKFKLEGTDISDKYHISCTFDEDNILKYLQSNNRYIVARFDGTHVIIETEFPFDAEVLLIIHRS